jgi:hypothetical protein
MQGATAEACNGLDDDCDGATDEELGTTTCGKGACLHTVDNCAGGKPVTCDPMQGATAEACNGLDDDCDGNTDGQTDVACGGPCSPPCGEGKKCVLGTDCVTGICQDGICQAPVLTVGAGKTVYYENLAAHAQVVSLTGAAAQVESASAASGFVTGDEVLLINLQGAAADSGSAGAWETARVLGVSNAVVTLDHAPARTYGKGGSNSDLTGQKVFLVEILRYSAVTIEGTLTAKPWNGSSSGLGLVAVRATGKLTVASSGAIDVSSAGFRSASYSCNGVSGLPGESFLPQPALQPNECWYPSPTNNPNGGGGGGGLSNCNTYSCSTQQVGAAGGGAAYGTAGVAGLDNGTLQKGGKPGVAYGKADLTSLFPGSGGGAGAGGYSGPGTGTSGGRGGGIVYLAAQTLDVQGAIRSNGQKGGENANCGFVHGSGSGGGGSGGSVYLRGHAVTLAVGKVAAMGAAGGCNGGGAGGDGRIRVDYNALNGAAYPGGSAAVTTPAAYLGPGI